MSKNKRPATAGAMRCKMGAIAAFLLLTGCGETMVIGAGCEGYAEARLSRPSYDLFPAGPWGEWIADTDDRMTGICTGAR